MLTSPDGLEFTADGRFPKSDDWPEKGKNFTHHEPKKTILSIILCYRSDPIEQHDMEVDLSRSTNELHDLQIRVFAWGLNGNTYKCLHGRSNVKHVLLRMLNMDRNSLRGLHNTKELTVVFGNCLALELVCHLGRELESEKGEVMG